MISLYLRLLSVALRNPILLPALAGTAWAFRARGWYRRPPFLPLPPGPYLRWRMETAYGDPEAVPSREEAKRFLLWARALRKRCRRGGE